MYFVNRYPLIELLMNECKKSYEEKKPNSYSKKQKSHASYHAIIAAFGRITNEIKTTKNLNAQEIKMVNLFNLLNALDEQKFCIHCTDYLNDLKKRDPTKAFQFVKSISPDNNNIKDNKTFWPFLNRLFNTKRINEGKNEEEKKIDFFLKKTKELSEKITAENADSNEIKTVKLNLLAIPED